MSSTALNVAGILPWQQAQWQQIWASRNLQKSPHAFLLHGLAATGKAQFAVAYAQSLCCQQPAHDGRACGRCRDCAWFVQGHHPDCILIEPEAEHKAIGIDRIRECVQALHLKSHAGGSKILIIHPAENMQTAAANSLLKTLEEPPGNSVLLLVSHQPGRLLATIRSRCQTVRFCGDYSTAVVEWLQQQSHKQEHEVRASLALAQGAPLSALKYLQQDLLPRRDQVLQSILDLSAGKSDPIQVAGSWLKSDLAQPLYWLSGMVLDWMRLQVSEKPPHLCHPEWQQRFVSVVVKLSRRQIHHLGREVNRAIQLLRTSVNNQMLMENVCIQFSKVSLEP